MWNSFITSYRFILKSKTYTILNLTGLVAGLTASYILLLFTFNQISYEQFQSKGDRVYRIINKDSKGSKYMLTPFLLGSRLQSESRNIEAAGRIVFMSYFTGPVSVKKNGEFVENPRFICADQEILDILTLKIIRGKVTDCLDMPTSVILSESAASDYFGAEDPVGKALEIRTGGTIDTLIVSGVFEDLPWNSTLKADMVAGTPVLKRILKRFSMDPDVDFKAMDDPSVETFILLRTNGTLAGLLRELPGILKKSGVNVLSSSFSFQNIRNIYLGSTDVVDDMHLRGSKTSIYIYSSLALFILFLAGINYSILSTARSALRFKEIGVRKVLGASRGALRRQVLTESVLLTLMAFLISFLLIGLAEPFMQGLFGYSVKIYSASTLVYIPLFASLAVFIGLLSGAYLSFYLSALNPLLALKNKLLAHKRVNMSKVFTVFQLLITMMLLTSVITIYLQIDLCINSDMGIKKDDLMLIKFDPKEFKFYQQLKAEVKKNPDVLSVSGSSFAPPDNSYSLISLKSFSSEEPVTVESYSVDEDFFRTMGIKVVSGTEFDKNDTFSRRTKVIANEEAVKVLGLKKLKGFILPQVNKVVGVVRNVNIHSMYSKVNPTLFIFNPSACKVFTVRCKPGRDKEVLEYVRNSWKSLAPTLPFDYRFFTTELNIMYKKERTLGQVVTAFTVLAFIIMGMGLFGLALLISERKTKETAIRKVFGASNVNILFGMQKEFLIYIAIAAVISVPVTWYVMNRWLDGFFYRITMHWWIYVSSILSITIFVSAIILLRTLNVLRQNPVNALKYE